MKSPRLHRDPLRGIVLRARSRKRNALRFLLFTSPPASRLRQCTWLRAGLPFSANQPLALVRWRSRSTEHGLVFDTNDRKGSLRSHSSAPFILGTLLCLKWRKGFGATDGVPYQSSQH